MELKPWDSTTLHIYAGPREQEWLGDLMRRLAAVERWRGHADDTTYSLSNISLDPPRVGKYARSMG